MKMITTIIAITFYSSLHIQAALLNNILLLHALPDEYTENHNNHLQPHQSKKSSTKSAKQTQASVPEPTGLRAHGADVTGPFSPIPGAQKPRGLTIPVQFPDDPATKAFDPINFPSTQAAIHRYCNNFNYTEGGNTSSIRQYFLDQSRGKSDFTNLVTKVITLPRPRNSYYYYDYPKNTHVRPNITAAKLILRETITTLNKTGENLDGITVKDDTIQYTTILFPQTNRGRNIRPHIGINKNTNITLTVNGKKAIASRFHISGIDSATPSLRMFAHETGHLVYNLPDLYDNNLKEIPGDTGIGKGTGFYSLMSGSNVNNGRTPTPMNIYHKYILGWADIIDITADQYLNTSLTAEKSDGFRIVNPANPKEFFIIENRGGKDRWAQNAVIDQGILIWHIDETKGRNTADIRSPEFHYRVSLEQQDGKFDLENGLNKGDHTDAFDNTSKVFDDHSTPSARWWDGTKSGIRIQVNSPPGSVMNLTLGAPPKDTHLKNISLLETIEGSIAKGEGLKTIQKNYDASNADKLIVILGAEHAWPGKFRGNFQSVTYAGRPMTKVISKKTAIPTLAFFYLDNPGQAGDLKVNQANHNGSHYAIYQLKGTAPGIGAKSSIFQNQKKKRKIPLQTTEDKSLIIAAILNAGENGKNGAPNMIAAAPLKEDTPTDLFAGNRWTSFSSGHCIEPNANSKKDYAFRKANNNDLTSMAAIEIKAQTKQTKPVLRNLCLEPSAVASQSSNAFPNSKNNTGFAKLAIDGNTNGVWNWQNPTISHTRGDTPKSWWQVNLGPDRLIDHIILYNRTDFHNGKTLGNRLSNFKITVINKAGIITAREIFYENSGYANTTKQWNTGGVIGHRVRIELLGKNRRQDHTLQLAEVQVFGEILPITKKLNKKAISNKDEATNNNLNPTQIDLKLKALSANPSIGEYILSHLPNAEGKLDPSITYQWSLNLKEWHLADGITPSTNGITALATPVIVNEVVRVEVKTSKNNLNIFFRAYRP